MILLILLSIIILKVVYDLKIIYCEDVGQPSHAILVEDRETTKKEPTVVIIGAGAAGLSV
jgi:threonine dehydrogenase-like Zn-dependent dehydrogenase